MRKLENQNYLKLRISTVKCSVENIMKVPWNSIEKNS